MGARVAFLLQHHLLGVHREWKRANMGEARGKLREGSSEQDHMFAPAHLENGTVGTVHDLEGAAGFCSKFWMVPARRP